MNLLNKDYELNTDTLQKSSNSITFGYDSEFNVYSIPYLNKNVIKYESYLKEIYPGYYPVASMGVTSELQKKNGDSYNIVGIVIDTDIYTTQVKATGYFPVISSGEYRTYGIHVYCDPIIVPLTPQYGYSWTDWEYVEN